MERYKLLDRAISVRENITYKAGYSLECKLDVDDRVYFQVVCDRPDVLTGQPGTGRGGRAYLNPGMTDDQLVRLAFGLFLAYEEHECREFFSYRGKRVFNPHITIDALAAVADQLEVLP